MSHPWQQRSSKRKSSKGQDGARKSRKKRFPRLGRQRRQANQRERVRAQRITLAIDDLRCVLWKEDSDPRSRPIIQTLKTAMEYIELLKKTSEGEEIAECETHLPAFNLLERYCKNDLLTTKADRPPPVQERPDSLDLSTIAKAEPNTSDSAPTCSSLASSGCSSCSSELWEETDLKFSTEFDDSFGDDLLSDLRDYNDLTDILALTSTFDLERILDNSPAQLVGPCIA